MPKLTKILHNFKVYLLNKVMERVRAFIIVGAMSLCVYFITRAIYFAYADYSIIEKVWSLIILVAEGYILLHAFGYILSVFKVSYEYNLPHIENYDFRKAPTVAVVIAERHEPKLILDETINTLINLDYPHKNIYILDDSSEPKFQHQADNLVQKYGIHVYRRSERHGAKAGILNDFLKNAQEKYIAIFDADQNPMPNFLKQIIPIIESDKKIAFIQTPQFYTNINASTVSKGATFQQVIFYENICEGKSMTDAMFCCGTNVLFRKEALEKVGYFDEESITEDFSTSIKFHCAKYKSFYYNHVAAFGMAPETLSAYFKQQTRWACGTISVFYKLIKLLFKNPSQLTLAQWWEYFLSGSYYFIGWAFFFLMLGPIAFLIFNIPAFFLSPEIYLTVFVPYFLFSLLIFYSTMTKRHYHFSQIYYGVVLGILSFPILMKAAVYGLINKKIGFVITTKGQKDTLPLKALWPYFAMIFLNMIAFIFGFYRIYKGENIYAIAVNMFWVLYHLFLLFHIFIFNQESVVADEKP
jgi:cellulose synthase (UDP-forming)